MIKFFKYNSCGNDFIIIDNRKIKLVFQKSYIKFLCDRERGVGADGFILLEEDAEVNYFMNYFNSDGLPSSFCGNGSMCCAHFAMFANSSSGNGSFRTREGVFDFQVNLNNSKTTISMIDVFDFHKNDTRLLINTGSPHYVSFVSNIDDIDVNNEGGEIRFSSLFKSEGVNVTFANCVDSTLSIRTYERGVESETLSCGTGAVAAVLAAFICNLINKNSILVHTRGGDLKVQFKNHSYNFTDIKLTSIVQQDFEGILPVMP
tara:strand:- start:759 stop:1541 length:783 start_codon:yes stop_codon:yes gene_type:complete